MIECYFNISNTCQFKVIFILVNSNLFPVFQRLLFVKFVPGDGCAMVLKSEVKYSYMSIAISATQCSIWIFSCYRWVRVLCYSRAAVVHVWFLPFGFNFLLILPRGDVVS